MSRSMVDKVARSLLYEGYMLYPYRRSALKNQHRFNFGVVYPEGLEPSLMQTECMVEGAANCGINVEVRFLQVYEKDSWQEVLERSVTSSSTGIRPFDFGALRGELRIEREALEPTLHKIRVQIRNRTIRQSGSDPLLQSLVSTHTILNANGGEFISLLDPPDRFRDAVAACRNIGAWPVLVGKEPERRCMLLSPIILYDYPRVADESPEDLFDCTEIDEILNLRILTLSDAEKEEMRRSGPHERRLLERAEALTPQQMLKLRCMERCAMFAVD